MTTDDVPPSERSRVAGGQCVERLVELAERNVQVHETIFGQIRERVAGGIGSEADVTQTESRLSQARVTLTETTERLRSTYAAYATLTGQVPDSVQLPAFQDAT